MYLSDVYTIPVNLAGNCALSVPAGLDAATGMPIGLQIIGDYFAEPTLLAAAAAFERAVSFEPVPPLVRALQDAKGGV